MGRTPESKGRRRVGRVSYYFRHGAWHVYYRDGGRQVRRRVGQSEQEASQVAAQVNAQLGCSIPTPFSFTPLSVPELRSRFLEHHELALRSSLATVRRYRAATQHLEDFANQCGRNLMAHDLAVEGFVRYLRTIHVAPILGKHLDDPHEDFKRWFFENLDNIVHQIAKRKRPGGPIERDVDRS